MHIVYIHQHFTTNAGASGTRSFDYARYLVAAGHEVTVISGVYALGPFGDLGPGLFHIRWVEGIRLCLIKVPYGNKMSFAARALSFLAFAFLSVVACLRQKNVDVVLATSTPLTVGVPALAMRWLRRVPYVFEVRDIWPEFAVSIGVLKNPLVIKLASWAEALFYRHAAKVLTISEGMRQILARRGLSQEKLAMVPTGVDLSLYKSLQADPGLRRRLGWQGRLLAVYAGAHSDANALEYVIEAAAKLKDRDDIGVVLIGDGRRKAHLQAMAERLGLRNLAFHDKLPKRELIGYLMDADVGLMILKDLPDFRCAMPNKLFDYLAAGCVVLVNFAGDAADALATEGAGVASRAGNPESLAEALGRWAEDRDALQAAKAGAARLAARYDRKEWARQLEEILASAARPTAQKN